MAVFYQAASQFVDSVENRIERVPIGVPDYDRFQTPTLLTGKQGSSPGKLDFPHSLAIDEATNEIFVANHINGRIEIFSETGEYNHQLGIRQLTGPMGIAIHMDSVYVSCSDNTISKFSLTDKRFVKQIGGWGSNKG